MNFGERRTEAQHAKAVSFFTYKRTFGGISDQLAHGTAGALARIIHE